MSPRSGRSTAPGRSGTSTGVSSRPNSLLSGRTGRLHDVEELRELLHRLEQVREREHEERDRADGEGVGVHPPAADADRDRGGEQARELDDRQVPGRDLHRAHVGVEEAPAAGLEAGRLHVLPAERLHHPHPGDALLQVREGVADAIADVEVGDVRVALELDAGHDHDRQADDRQGAGASTTRRPARRPRSPSSSPLLTNMSRPIWTSSCMRVHVARHAGHDHAGLLAVVERHREALQVVEHPQPEVSQERLTDAADEQHLEPVGDVGDGGHDDVADDGRVERSRRRPP